MKQSNLGLMLGISGAILIGSGAISKAIIISSVTYPSLGETPLYIIAGVILMIVSLFMFLKQ